MEKIALAKKIEFQDGKEPHQGQIIVEPLYPGYGMTLGNSLRRVLLSSLPGAAVCGVKIKGISHEFSALPNVKEDILELVLNLKQLRVKMFTEEDVKLQLEVSGKKIVKASDIKKDSLAEIVNPDLEIAHITDAAGHLEMEITVRAGRGYKMSEDDDKKSDDIGFMEIDSIFSPVLACSVKVDNVRVGKMTNWDQVILDVKTDGTISYREAFEGSVAILIEQFNGLLDVLAGRETDAIANIDKKLAALNEETVVVPMTEADDDEEIEEAEADEVVEEEVKPKKKAIKK